MTTNERIQTHWEDAHCFFPRRQIVGLFLQGSQNYGLDTPESDVDSKLIVLPSFKDIAMNKPPISTTNVRENNEHIDFKDIRLYMKEFRKQNINFMEILFTPWYRLHMDYGYEWMRLVDNRERIVRINPVKAVKATYGMALEKYNALEHKYPSRMKVINKYKYDPKQLSHLLRLYDFLKKYIAGKPYGECINVDSPQYLIDVKQGLYDLEEARSVADETVIKIQEVVDHYLPIIEELGVDEEMEELLDDVQYQIMRQAIKAELEYA